MSDNPADSLRRELEAAMIQASQELRSEAPGRRSRALTLVPAEAVESIWPLVLAALEAARADERERARRQAFTEAAEAIEALEDGSTEPFVLTEKAAALVRGLGEGTENA